MLPEAAARQLYESWHESVDSASADETPWHALVTRHLGSGDLLDRTVLEIGCGRGELAARLVAGAIRPRRLHAVDFAESAVRSGSRRLGQRHRVAWAVGSIRQIPYADESFDTVVSCETIEHVVDPVAALQEVRRVLRTGGRLLLTTPNYLGPMGLYRAYLRAIGRRYTEGGQPICHFTSLPRTIAWVRRAGLSVRTVDAVGHYLPWPGRRPIAIDRLDAVRALRWCALHSIVIAAKP